MIDASVERAQAQAGERSGRRRAAVHEAAHAVVTRELGYRVRTAHVAADGRGPGWITTDAVPGALEDVPVRRRADVQTLVAAGVVGAQLWEWQRGSGLVVPQDYAAAQDGAVVLELAAMPGGIDEDEANERAAGVLEPLMDDVLELAVRLEDAGDLGGLFWGVRV